jgi:hypothetical protein
MIIAAPSKKANQLKPDERVLTTMKTPLVQSDLVKQTWGNFRNFRISEAAKSYSHRLSASAMGAREGFVGPHSSPSRFEIPFLFAAI